MCAHTSSRKFIRCNDLRGYLRVEVCAIKDPMPADGPCVFTGRTAIYFGDRDFFDDGKGHVMQPNQPLPVCDKTASALAALGRNDLFISESTWFYDGGGCC